MARRYVRDNRGRFATTASGGATGRGGRLRTAAGNKRATQTIEAGGRKGVIGKPRGLAPGSIKPKPKLTTIGAKLAARDQAAGRSDGAAVNISLGGARGKRLDAEISRNVKAQQVASRKADKARNIALQAKWSAAKAARDAAKPKRIRSAESLRMSRAKQIEARRMQKIDALPESTLAKRARNSARTQAKALAFYKGPRGLAPVSIKPKVAAAPKARAAKTPRISEEKAQRIAARINALNGRGEGKSSKARIRALNRSEVRTRAISFLRGKKNAIETGPKDVAASIAKRNKLSTLTPNKGTFQSKYDSLGQSALRARRAAGLKADYSDSAIRARLAKADAMTARNGGVMTKASARAREIYEAQLRGTMVRGKGAALPGSVQFRMKYENARVKNVMRGAKPAYGAPVKGTDVRRISSTSRPSSTVSSGVSAKATARGQAKIAKLAKLDPFQRSEAAHAKRKFGVHSTISNPGIKSKRAPRTTASGGKRVAVTGRSKAQIATAYRSSIKRLGSIATRRQQIKARTTADQGNLFGGSTPLKAYKRRVRR